MRLVIYTLQDGPSKGEKRPAIVMGQYGVMTGLRGKGDIMVLTKAKDDLSPTNVLEVNDAVFEFVDDTIRRGTKVTPEFDTAQ